jgi:predicted transcriptional regulator
VLMTMKIDGAKLRQLRYERFLNVGELADKAGLNAWTISRLESGDWPGGSRPATVRKLGQALEVDPHELLAEED